MRTLDESMMKTVVVYYTYAVRYNKVGQKLSKNELLEGSNSLVDFLDAADDLQHIYRKNRVAVDKEVFGTAYGNNVDSIREEAWNIIRKVMCEGLPSVLFREGELETHPQKELINRFYGILPKLLSVVFDNSEQTTVFCDFHSIHERYGDWSDQYRSYGFCFSEDALKKIRQRYKIGIDEAILYVMENNYDYGTFKFRWGWKSGLVITDLGIYYANKIDNTFQAFESTLLSWDDFDKVEYKELTYYFYNGEELVYQLDKGILFDNQDPNECISFAEDLSSITQSFVPDLSPIELAERGDFEKALAKADNMIKSDKDVAFGHLSKAQVMRMIEFKRIEEEPSYEESAELKKKLEIVLKELKKAITEKEAKDENDKKEFVTHALLCTADTERELGQLTASRRHLIEALGNCVGEDKDDVTESLICVEESLQESWNHYITEHRYKDRKFIMLIRDNEIGGCITDGITTFRMSNIPSCMKFPSGHPIANQLYIGHPFNPSLYVPFEQSEELFFLDKVHEFRYLLECLGAEEISITSIKGKDVSEFRDSNNRYAVDGEIKRFSAGVEVNTEYKNQNDSTSHSHRSMIVKLDPLQKPFLPDGLIWYNEMPQWQRLVQSRLHGNLLEYSEFVSTAETKFTSSSEMTDIKASAKFLWAKANAEVNECFEKQFKESTETQWKVDVKFRSMKGFENQMSDTIKNEKVEPVNQIGWSKEEQGYAEEVKFCLEDDGVIDDSERRLLERKRIKFGISQKRAAEIENSLLQSQLTEDEQEYLEAVKEELDGGKIPEASRRLLERLRKRMDVSDERAKEIETMAMKR